MHKLHINTDMSITLQEIEKKNIFYICIYKYTSVGIITI